MRPWLGITWGISNRYGWGVYGLNLVLELLRRKGPFPVCLGDIVTAEMTPDLVDKLQKVIEFQNQHLQSFFRMGQVAKMGDATVLHALGNGMEWSLTSQAVEGDANIGVIFFEYTDITPDGRARLSKLNGTIAGSTWNADVLKGWGINNVEAVFQGVNGDLFRPMVRSGIYEGKFAIFSGGKLDFRKGQDIVLKAFKAFSSRHDDAILVTAWQNLWPLTAMPMKYSTLTTTLPDVRADNSLNLTKWASEAGVDPEKFVDLGMVANEAMPGYLKEFDLAVFPNRCEGGTNLVAMEAMACGVPCIIANNTGQRDLIGDGNCFTLEKQGKVVMPGASTDGWGETDVDELVEMMETAYQNRGETRNRGQAGADFMQSWSWPTQIGKLLDAVEALG